MDVTVCIPTLNRYDRLANLIESLLENTIVPNIYVIDNGNNIYKNLPKKLLNRIEIFSPGKNIGVAASWNYFLKNIPEMRIISNDDICFSTNAIEKFRENFVEESMLFPAIIVQNQFSCFSLPDKIIEKIGYFDETISPNYAYFEDNDYCYRMQLENINRIRISNLTVFHSASSTVKSYTKEERKEHDRRFKLAKQNYIAKWGGEPGKEKYVKPFNK